MRLLRMTVLALAVLPAPALLCAGDSFADPAALTEARQWTAPDGGVFRYRWHEPANPREGRVYPLVILMHGAGERGTNNVSQLKWGAREIFDCLRRRGEEFFFVAGQVPEGKRWVEVDWGALAHAMPAEPSETMARQLALVGHLLATRPEIDRARVYATGVSMGGYGTWDILCRRPEWFAAAMPICGGGDAARAYRMRGVPIWAYHGDGDEVVPVARSRAMVSALWACDGKVKYTEYPGVGHDCWIRAYGDGANLDWLLSQRKAPARNAEAGGFW